MIKGSLKVFKGCLGNAERMLKRASKMFKSCLDGAWRVLEVLRECLRVLEGCFKGAER